MLNGEIHKSELNINADSLFDIKLLTGYQATALMGSRGVKGVIYAVTKQFAIASYQKTLGRFSPQYKKEVEQELRINHNDKGFVYTIVKKDGSVLTGDELIRALYDIPAANIKKIELSKQETCCGTNKRVYITLKNNI